MGQPQVRRQAGQPGQQAHVRDHRRRHRPGRRRRRGHARRARLPRQGLHLPRLAPPGPLDRRPGRHQRGQELQERRRQRLPPLLRHGEGRRLPRPRGQRLPPGRGVASTSSTSASPRACPSPASTAACSTTAPSAAPRCRARSTPGARPASSSCSAPTRRWRARSASAPSSSTPAPRCSTSSSSTAGPPASSSATCSPARSRSHSAHAVVLATGGYGTSSSSRPTPRPATSPRSGGPTGEGALFANPCFTQIHPTCIPASDEFQSKLTLMSESLRNDGRIWVPKDARRRPLARPDPRGRARLLPRAPYPAFGNLVPRDVASPRRQARGRRRAAASAR